MADMTCLKIPQPNQVHTMASGLGLMSMTSVKPIAENGKVRMKTRMANAIKEHIAVRPQARPFIPAARVIRPLTRWTRGMRMIAAFPHQMIPA